MVYQEKFANRQQLRTAIVNAFGEISPSLCAKVCESVTHRLRRCIAAERQHFEHLT